MPDGYCYVLGALGLPFNEQDNVWSGRVVNELATVVFSSLRLTCVGSGIGAFVQRSSRCGQQPLEWVGVGNVVGPESVSVFEYLHHRVGVGVSMMEG